MHERFLQVSTLAREPPTTAVEPTGERESSCELTLIEILRRPVDGTTAHEAHRRKEQEIGEVFAKLTEIEAGRLHKRLTNPAATDELASAFGRLIIERRARLLAFLGDARRRAAIQRTARAA